MTRTNLYIRTGIAVCVIGWAFFALGRPLWQPVVLKIKGAQTTGEVLSRLAKKMKGRFEQVDELTDGRSIALLAFKEERRLELWKHHRDGWGWVKSYPFTGFSGALGPKLREGDRQIPEGVYAIASLNPNSLYHLSMKINYPNAFDQEKAKTDQRAHPGSDIFIHGDRLTVGCIPLGDENIEEVFYLVGANGFKNTRVIIAPRDLRGSDRVPELASLPWADELYAEIARALETFPRHAQATGSGE